MNMNEIATATRSEIPVIEVVVNNHVLGMVRQWQNLIYHQRYSETTLDRGPDFVKLAEAYGLKGFRVTSMAEMEAAFQEALTAGCGCVRNIGSITIPEQDRRAISGISNRPKRWSDSARRPATGRSMYGPADGRCLLFIARYFPVSLFCPIFVF